MILEAIIALQIYGGSPWPEQAPSQYAHPYTGHLVVKRGTPTEIHSWCHNSFARACAKPAGSSCTIYLPAPTLMGAPVIYKALYDHEVAHCNGWRHPSSG